MPLWSQEFIEPPWPKKHTVNLQKQQQYDEYAKRGGSNRIERHKPGSLAGGHGRKAGASDLYEEHQDDQGHTLRKDLHESSWQEALEDASQAVSVRDVKNAVPNYKTSEPRHHAFARFVLPVKSAAFSDQDWPGKKVEEKGGKEDEEKGEVEDDEGGPKDGPEMSPEDKRFFDMLIQEEETQRAFGNNDGKPEGDLKLLDEDVMEQLESALSVEDQSTPDSWVPRSTRLLRLAGVHPVNAEPDITEMFDAGMITPTKLHYVRSHGPVPQLTWEDHRLTVFSDPPEIIADPKNWSMEELTSGKFRIFEIPVTIACDGNRRKEMTVVKQASGVGFSAAAVSTCLWRGIHVRDVLLASGLQDQPDTERWHLNFEGADECSEGQYATSIPLMHVMDINNDVMLAFGQNGRVLHPDHGYPLRMIVPGYVGGRQVKWVHKMWITKKPNSSYYHIWDNRLTPSFIESKDHPLASLFYHHENTACHEQILQSVICKPAHNETVSLSAKDDGTPRVYNVQGFAYNGRGTHINRVELTLDGGKTWKYCLKRWVDKPLRYGEKHWAWIFWSCEVPLNDLANAKEFAVRAIDSTMQTQPENLIWNMMGMMNNSWYRLRPCIIQDPETNEALVQFKHPVAPGNDDSGWMKPNPENMKGDGESASAGNDRVLSLEEIAKHDKKDDAWIILENKVYDVTSVLSWHPGGDAAILTYAGKATVDTTNQYKGIHDQYANSKRDECLIGVLSPEAVGEMEKDAERAAKELAKVKKERKGFSLQPDLFTRATLVERKDVSADTRIYKFALPTQDNGEHGVLGLPIGQHVLISLHFEDQAVLRAYTPISPVLPEEEDGTVTFCIKTYFPTDGGPFPPGGLISNYLDCMKDGEEIDIRGPMGEIIYKGRGEFTIEGKDYHFDKVNLVAGGSGLTPHWQLIHAMLKTEGDNTLISMIDSNKSFEDILLHDKLKEYAEKYSDRFKLWHAVGKAPENVPDWPYGEGRLDQELMEKQFYPPEEGVVTLLCGPPGLIEKGAIPGLEKMGFEKGKNIFGF